MVCRTIVHFVYAMSVDLLDGSSAAHQHPFPMPVMPTGTIFSSFFINLRYVQLDREKQRVNLLSYPIKYSTGQSLAAAIAVT